MLVPNNASQQRFPESYSFRYGSTLLLKRPGVTTCQVRKWTAFIEYVQYMLEDIETFIHVHLWLATNDFNYSDGFTHRLWWICAYFFIGLKVVVYLPSKDIVGNSVTSCIFHVFMKPGISAIVLISPHASRIGVCVCVCVCVCVFVSAYEGV